MFKIPWNRCDDGVVRLSMTHYNNNIDTEKVIKALKNI